jgi:hypothetical protein
MAKEGHAVPLKRDDRANSENFWQQNSTLHLRRRELPAPSQHLQPECIIALLPKNL